MDLVLRHDRRQGPKAFDDRPHIGPNSRAGQEDRRLTQQCKSFEGLAHCLNELLQLGGRHYQLLVFAVALQGIGKGLFPIRREGDQRNNAALIRRGIADLSRQPRPDMFRDRRDVARIATSLGNALQNIGQIADRHTLGQQALQHTLGAANGDL